MEELNFKKWLLWLIFAITLCSGCKTTQTSIKVDEEQSHITIYDTTRVVNTINFVDTTHVEYLNTTTTHTVEYYDPETGMLRQRVIDQQSNIKMLQDQLLSMQMMLDSMRSIKADTTHIVMHEEEKEEVVEKHNNCSIYAFFLLLGVILALIFRLIILYIIKR